MSPAFTHLSPSRGPACLSSGSCVCVCVSSPCFLASPLFPTILPFLLHFSSSLLPCPFLPKAEQTFPMQWGLSTLSQLCLNEPHPV